MIEDVLRECVDRGSIKKRWRQELITMNSVTGRRILEIIRRG